MSEDSIQKSLMLKTAAAWELTYCEPMHGWPDEYAVVWRNEEFHGKISGTIKSKRGRPTPSRIAKELRKELLDRLGSSLRCDAKRVAYQWLSKSGIPLPISSEQIWKILDDSLYSLDNKVGMEFWSPDPPKLFSPGTHGWILAELAEMRCLISSLRARQQEVANG